MSYDASHRDSPDAGPEAGAVAEELRAAIEQRLLEHDKHGAVAVALTAVSDGRIGIAELYEAVLGPALVDIGARWQHGSTAVWEEHLASAAVRTIVEALYPEVERLRAAAPSAGRIALLACPPEEAHDLGLRMLADRLALAGWTVYFLGPDTPANELIAAARSLKADALILSSSTHYHRLRLRELVERLDEALPGVNVWVGGPGFVGADDAWIAAHLFDESVVSGRARGSAPAADPADDAAPRETNEKGAGDEPADALSDFSEDPSC